MKRDGAVTIFLSLILVCVSALLCGLVESARTAGVRFYLQTAADSCLDSVFSEYNNALWDKYRLLLRDYGSDEMLMDRCKLYLDPYVKNSGIYALKDPEIVVEDRKCVTDDGGAWLEKEITSFMKYKIAGDVLVANDPQKLWEKVKEAQSMKSITQDYGEQSKQAVRVEKGLKRINESLKGQKSAKEEALFAAQSQSSSTARAKMEEILEQVHRMKSLSKKYAKEQEKFNQKMQTIKGEHSEDWGQLSGENQGRLEGELSSYDSYDEESRQRQVLVQTAIDEDLALEESVKELIEKASWIEAQEDEEDEEEEHDYSEDYEELAEGIANLNIPELGSKLGVEQEDRADQLERLLNLLRGDVLSLVIPIDCTVSQASWSTQSWPSNVARTARTQPEPSFIDTLLIDEYATDFFPDFTDHIDDDCSYELEYIVNGRNSDAKNLELTLIKILAIREGLNYVHILMDQQKMSQVHELAMAIAGMFCIPALVGVISALIIGVWALAESITDLQDLLKGEEVSLYKNASEWKVELNALFSMEKEGVKAEKKENILGLNYEGYIKLILFVQDGEKKDYRMMDLIQSHIAATDSSFAMKNMLYGTKVTVRAKSKRVFSNLGIARGSFSGLSPEYGLHVDGVKAY